MPKIIKNLDEKIYSAAFELFREYRYSGVDMKMIAKKVGIAVGTLYNYYSNKEELFIKVFEESWRATLDKLDKIAQGESSPRKRLKSLLGLIYDDIQERKGLGNELKETSLDTEKFNSIWKSIHERILDSGVKVIDQIIEDENLDLDIDYKQRTIEMLLVTSAMIFSLHTGEHDKNKEFLYRAIDKLI